MSRLRVLTDGMFVLSAATPTAAGGTIPVFTDAAFTIPVTYPATINGTGVFYVPGGWTDIWLTFVYGTWTRTDHFALTGPDIEHEINAYDIPYNTLLAALAAALRAPVVVTLTSGPTIAVDASSGTLYPVTLDGNRTFGAPTNPVHGKMILFAISQDSSGSRVPTWNGVYRFSTEIPQPVLTTTPLALDYVGFIYNGTAGKWDCLGVVRGFS